MYWGILKTLKWAKYCSPRQTQPTRDLQSNALVLSKIFSGQAILCQIACFLIEQAGVPYQPELHPGLFARSPTFKQAPFVKFDGVGVTLVQQQLERFAFNLVEYHNACFLSNR